MHALSNTGAILPKMHPDFFLDSEFYLAKYYVLSIAFLFEGVLVNSWNNEFGV